MTRTIEPFGRRLRRFWWRLLLTIVVGLGAVTLVGVRGVGHSFPSNLSYDIPFWFRRTRALWDIVVIEITQKTLQTLGDDDGKLDRTNHINFLHQLSKAKPKLVSFDIAFTTPKLAVDANLAAEFAKLTNRVVIGGYWERKPLEGGSALAWERHDPLEIFQKVTHWGYLDVASPKEGTVVRQLWTGVPWAKDALTAAWETAHLLNSEISRPEDVWLNYYGRGVAAFDRVNYEDICNGDSKTLAKLSNRIVFVGYVSDAFKHPVRGKIPGVFVQATAVRNLSNGEWLRRVPEVLQIVLILAAGAGASFALTFLPLARARILLGGGVVGCMIVSLAFQNWAGYWWDWGIPVFLQAPAIFLFTAFDRLDAFISYRSSDGETSARALQQGLLNFGRTAYLAPGAIIAGARFPIVLLRAIRKARIFVLVLTPQALESLHDPESWIALEVRHALKIKRRIIILRVHVPQLSAAAIPLEFCHLAEMHALEFRVDDGFPEMIKAIIEAVEAKDVESS